MRFEYNVRKGFEKYYTFPNDFDTQKYKAELEAWLKKLSKKLVSQS